MTESTEGVKAAPGLYMIGCTETICSEIQHKEITPKGSTFAPRVRCIQGGGGMIGQQNEEDRMTGLFCKDCRHFRPAVDDSSDGECMADHPARETVVSKVTGKLSWRWRFASTLRADPDGRCGPDGSWFEAKDS